MGANACLILVLLSAIALDGAPVAFGQPGRHGPGHRPGPGKPTARPTRTPRPAGPSPPATPAATAKPAVLAALNAVLNPGSAATLLRLAFHDAGTYVKVNNTGGANGSLRFEINAPSSAGLQRGLQLLQQVQQQLARQNIFVSYADLFQLGGAAGVHFTGGPDIFAQVTMGRKDATVADANLNQVLPAASGNQNAPSLKAMFAAKGLTTRELVALSGAHSIGRSRNARPRGPMTLFPDVFGIHYFTELLNGGGAFRSDKTLLSDPETLLWVQRYSADQALFFKDFTAAYLKLSVDGATTLAGKKFG